MDYTFLGWRDVLEFAGQKDAFALRHALRFDYVGAGLAFGFGLEVSFELLIVSWKSPCQGEEIILLWTFFTHSHQIFSQKVLPGEGIHSWKMINFLMMLHFHEYFRGDMPISPPKIPLRIILISFNFPFKFLCNFRYNFIVTI